MTRPAFVDLSPGLDRVGRACAWIEREDGFVLMTGRSAQVTWQNWRNGYSILERPAAFESIDN